MAAQEWVLFSKVSGQSLELAFSLVWRSSLHQLLVSLEHLPAGEIMIEKLFARTEFLHRCVQVLNCTCGFSRVCYSNSLPKVQLFLKRKRTTIFQCNVHLLSDKLQQWICRIYFISMESGKDLNPFGTDLSVNKVQA